MTNQNSSSTENILDPDTREVVDTLSEKYTPYNRYGFDNPNMDWIKLSGDINVGVEVFMLKMKAGGKSTPHIHSGGEEFLVIDGSIEDCDGTVFRAGQYVQYQPGSTHHSVSHEGCTLLVVLRGQNIAL